MFASGRVRASAIGLLAGITCLLVIYFSDYFSINVSEFSHNYQDVSTLKKDGLTSRSDHMTIVLVTCENRLELSLSSLKSILAFSRASFRVILYADVKNIQVLQDRIMEWPDDVLNRFTYDIRLVNFPKRQFQRWKTLFRACSTQRLFLTDMLPKEDVVLYMDADILLLRPVEDLWGVFDIMGPDHVMALSFDIEDMTNGLYRTKRNIPYFEPYGVNAGVMLMNLTRLRTFRWLSKVEPLLEQYDGRLRWADQDIVNIVFSENREMMFVMPCHWNFRRDNCEFHDSCKGKTPALLHGNQNLFMDDNEPALRSAQLAMQEYKLGTSLERNFIDPWEQRLRKTTKKTICVDLFLQYIKDWRAMARQLDSERGFNTASVKTT